MLNHPPETNLGVARNEALALRAPSVRVYEPEQQAFINNLVVNLAFAFCSPARLASLPFVL